MRIICIYMVLYIILMHYFETQMRSKILIEVAQLIICYFYQSWTKVNHVCSICRCFTWILLSITNDMWSLCSPLLRVEIHPYWGSDRKTKYRVVDSGVVILMWDLIMLISFWRVYKLVARHARVCHLPRKMHKKK